ncbi:DUF4365 domain-containing protein [Marinifilum fragile]|uniref:DUF4365 domain-containing protein n=1 Tax=Marinifilum fragile TaxID=570161 RepID=UPI002AA8D0FA|nr:DUF4365 domain-containing protein [Marinifilum fragile]
MDFPKRIKQHKAQSDSFAILLYKLKDLGIFRNVTENDYGIDFEIEIVHNEKLIGRYLKAQVKSAEDIYIRKDGIPTVGGIKQSTLLYWTELSYRSHVIVFAVDLTTEKIYLTKSIFWQATSLIDSSDNSKTIEFLPAIDIAELNDDVKKKEKTENFISSLLVKKVAFDRGITDIIFAHKTLLRNIKSLFELYTDTWHYDAWTEVQQDDVFKTVLECSQILIGFDLPEKLDDISEDERKKLFSFDYWARKTDWSYEEVSNQVAKTPLKAIYPLLLDRLQYYSDLVIKGAYYWISKDITYLKLVHETVIPSVREHAKMIHVDYEDTNFRNKESFDSFLFEMEKKYNK